nr:uncharacterized protein LOC123768185 [Procambarus clarkii]XP_045614540.1 uncharacterized protein LOC123768185 [Procambarus clarkii]
MTVGPRKLSQLALVLMMAGITTQIKDKCQEIPQKTKQGNWINLTLVEITQNESNIKCKGTNNIHRLESFNEDIKSLQKCGDYNTPRYTETCSITKLLEGKTYTLIMALHLECIDSGPNMNELFGTVICSVPETPPISLPPEDTTGTTTELPLLNTAPAPPHFESPSSSENQICEPCMFLARMVKQFCSNLITFVICVIIIAMPYAYILIQLIKKIIRIIYRYTTTNVEQPNQDDMLLQPTN